jgi:hypothetical protein
MPTTSRSNNSFKTKGVAPASADAHKQLRDFTQDLAICLVGARKCLGLPLCSKNGRTQRFALMPNPRRSPRRANRKHRRIGGLPKGQRTPMHFFRMTTCLLPLLLAALLVSCGGPGAKEAAKVEPGPLRVDQPVRGWNILSDSEPDGLAVIAAAPAYGINHLQLSHDIVHDLRDARDERRRGLAIRLTGAAHAAGIQEVILWDHALYPLD